jgi:hypothetical protein
MVLSYGQLIKVLLGLLLPFPSRLEVTCLVEVLVKYGLLNL